MVERHENAVLLHPCRLDDRDDALFELLIVTVRLELDDDPAPTLAHGQRLRERRHPLRGELRASVAADVDRAQLCRVALPDLRRVAADLHQVAVVHDEHLAVRRLLNVELDEVRVLLGREPKRRERVLGRGGR